MAGGMNTDSATATQRLVVFEPVVGVRYGFIRQAKHGALRFKRIPQKLIVLLQAYARIRLRPDAPGGKKMIKVRMCVHQRLDAQTKFFDSLHNPFRISAGIENVAPAALGITQHSAIALQGANRETLINNSHGVKGYRVISGSGFCL